MSASEDIIVLETLRCFGIEKFVELQMGRNQTKLTKPNPDPYIEAMRRLGVHSSKTIIFEDSPTGIKSGKGSLASVVRITAFAHHGSSQTIEGDYVEILDFKLLG